MKLSLLPASAATLAIGLVAFATGCGKVADAAPAPAGPAGATAAVTAPAPTNPASTRLDRLGLQIDVKGEVVTSDGMGKNAMMLTGPELGSMNVAEATAIDPKTLKAAQSDATLFKPKNVKGENLADGWALTYENAGSEGANYWVTVRRQVGGKSVMCSSVEDTAEKSSAVLAACKSLRP